MCKRAESKVELWAMQNGNCQYWLRLTVRWHCLERIYIPDLEPQNSKKSFIKIDLLMLRCRRR